MPRSANPRRLLSTEPVDHPLGNDDRPLRHVPGGTGRTKSNIIKRTVLSTFPSPDGRLSRLTPYKPAFRSESPEYFHHLPTPIPHPVKTILLSLVFLAAALPSQAESSFFRYLEQSAGQGTAESQFVLGLMYRDGWEGTLKSGSAADKWYDLAVEVGDQRPLMVFGLLQRGEDRITKDAATASKWLNLAAGSGDNYAQVILGEILLEGSGGPADWPRGTEWIRKSAMAGFAPAQMRLGVIYLVGDASLPKNEIEALAWFIVAAESGSKPAEAYRNQRVQTLGPEATRQAIDRSRVLSGEARKTAEGTGPKVQPGGLAGG